MRANAPSRHAFGSLPGSLRVPTFRAAAVAIVCLWLAGTARAQDKVTEADLVKNEPWGALADRNIELANVKFKEIYDGKVSLVKLPKGKLFVPASQASLESKLAGFKTAKGETLDKKGRSNVRILGIARDDASAGRTIEVTDVQKLPDDVDAYKARVAGLDAADADGRWKLAEEARSRADYYGLDDLRDWARQMFESSLDLRKAATPRSDAKAHIDIALKYRDVAGATAKAIAHLGDLVGDATWKDEERERATKILDVELGALPHRGRWVSRDEFKAALGFVARRDSKGDVTWVRRERIEFEQAVAKQRANLKDDPNPRKLLATQYEECALKGDVVVGMYKQEVVRTKGLTFPAFVDRLFERQGATDLGWDQWIMPDGTRLYFMQQAPNWILYAIKKKDEPLPR